MAAHQAPPSLGFSRQEHWSGLPFPSPMHAWKWKVKVKVKMKSCPTLSNPMDCSFPGSSVHGIFEARVLEWGAIAFSAFLSMYILLVISLENPNTYNIGIPSIMNLLDTSEMELHGVFWDGVNIFCFLWKKVKLKQPVSPGPGAPVTRLRASVESGVCKGHRRKNSRELKMPHGMLCVYKGRRNWYVSTSYSLLNLLKLCIFLFQFIFKI